MVLRLESVRNVLNRLVDGTPGLLISPLCKKLRRGFASGYHYKRVKLDDGERYHDRPNKNEYSHPHDALQYALLGMGEGRALLQRHERQNAPEPTQTDREYDPLRW